MLLQSVWLPGAAWNQKQFTQPWSLGGVCIQAGLLWVSVHRRDTLSGEKPFSRAGKAPHVTETAGCVRAWKGFHLISQTFQEIVSKYVLSTHDGPGGRDAVAIR